MPDNVFIFVYDVSSVIENIPFTVDFPNLLVIAHILILQSFDFFRIFIAIKESHNVFNLVFFTLVVIQLGHVAFIIGELGLHKLYLASVVYDITLRINEPSCTIDWSQVLVNPVSVLIFEYDCGFTIIIIKITEALVWVEIIPFNSEWKRYLDIVASVNTHELIVLENDVIAVSRPNISSLLIDEIASLVYRMALIVNEASFPQSVFSIND